MALYVRCVNQECSGEWMSNLLSLPMNVNKMFYTDMTVSFQQEGEDEITEHSGDQTEVVCVCCSAWVFILLDPHCCL